MKTRYPQRIRLCVEELEGRVVPSTLTYSSNWSGYALSTGAGMVSHVAANWVVPAVSSDAPGYSAAWVGIDGWSSPSVEQIGTNSNSVNGHADYFAWYEMYPIGLVQLDLTIRPGDEISASASYAEPNQFTLALTNVTTNESFTTTQTSADAPRSSAEWIQEAPSADSGVLPLASVATVTFSAAKATVGDTSGPADSSWPGSTLHQIDMAAPTGTIQAQPSALTSSGTPPTSTFSVTVASSSAAGKGVATRQPTPPSPGTPPTPTLSAAAAILLVPNDLPAGPQQAPPTVVPPQDAIINRTSPSAIVLPAAGSTQSPPTFVHFGSAGDDAAGQGADDRGTPQLQPPPAQRVAPTDAAAPSPLNGSSRAAANSTPANPPQAALEVGQTGDACLAFGQWLPAVALETASGGDHKGGRGIACASVVLTLALNGAGAVAMQEAKKSRKIREKSYAFRYEPAS